MLSAGAFTEPDHGSDITFMNTTAVKDGDEWVINGGKTFITNGGWPGFTMSSARPIRTPRPAYRGQSVILVEADREGLTTADVGQKMGIRMMATAEVTLKDVRVPLSNLDR
jgi:alkylation response protein AidB-like acyl-CoA dehydrogenase